MRCAALNTGSEFHSLDHLAPLAELMGMPLLTTEKRNEALTRLYYPQIDVRYMPDMELSLGALAEEFDTLFECKYWEPHLKSLFRELYQKEMRLIFCPHGQSDKGFQAPVLTPYTEQDGVLLYGDLLVQMLKDLCLWPSISSYAFIGNMRLHFYQKHKAFYDALVEKRIPLNKTKRTLLYAPTWRDVDRGTSFFHYGKKIIAELPEDWNLIIKPHPLLEERDPAHYYPIAALAERTPNVVLLTEFPLVYPVLARMDVFLGDSSSVGYDALHFQRPLYFFPTEHSGRLHACGKRIDPDCNLYLQIEGGNPFVEAQKELYRFAFGAKQSDAELKASIERCF